MAGEKFNVVISSSNPTLLAFTNFTVTCVSSSKYTQDIELHINGVNSSSYSNVFLVFKVQNAVSYKFMRVMPSHNGTMFTCVGRLSSSSPNHTSKAVFINVLGEETYVCVCVCVCVRMLLKYSVFPTCSSFYYSIPHLLH